MAAAYVRRPSSFRCARVNAWVGEDALMPWFGGGRALLVSQTARPSGAQPDGAQSVGAQPVGAQPDGVQPVGAQPDGVQPDGVQPVGAQPDGAQPDGAAALYCDVVVAPIDAFAI